MTRADGSCDAAAPDLVALALGQLAAEDAARIEVHAAQCADCRAELAATTRLLRLAREAPAPGPSKGFEERLLAAFRAERDEARAPESADVPPPATKRRGVAKLASMFVPLAAAASVLVAVIVASRERPAVVIEGEGFFHADGAMTASGVPVNIAGEFAFSQGAEIEAGRKPFTVRLALPPGGSPAVTGETRDAPSNRPAPGVVELTLLPGARVARRGAADLELLAGRVDVAAGRLAGPFTVHAPPGRAVVRGTRFSASTTERRLVVVVREGVVELGRDGGPSETLAPGEEGLVDAQRLLKRASDGRRNGDGFLTPRATLSVEPGGGRLVASLEVGEGGAVSILAFDDSEPRFLLRLKGDDGREFDVKLQRSMLSPAPPSPESRTWRLEPEHAYGFAMDPRTLGLPPGRYEARLRYMSYRARSDGAEWLGVTESDPTNFEITVR